MQRLTFAAILLLLACNNNSTGSDITTRDTSAVTTADSPTAMMTTIPVAQDTAGLRGEWFLQAVLPSDTATGKIPSLNFDLAKRRVSGNTGCNRLSGSFVLTDTSLTFGKDMITTKMACIGYNEHAFLENLVRTNHYKIKDSVLILMFDATELSRWTRKPEKPVQTGKA
ncbi:MAG: META domain-containing protein [Chitinophagaceae bacterium]